MPLKVVDKIDMRIVSSNVFENMANTSINAGPIVCPKAGAKSNPTV